MYNLKIKEFEQKNKRFPTKEEKKQIYYDVIKNYCMNDCLATFKIYEYNKSVERKRYIKKIIGFTLFICIIIINLLVLYCYLNNIS